MRYYRSITSYYGVLYLPVIPAASVGLFSSSPGHLYVPWYASLNPSPLESIRSISQLYITPFPKHHVARFSRKHEMGDAKSIVLQVLALETPMIKVA
jgi:hypothetical protein